MRTHQLQIPDAEETHEYSLFYTQGQNTPVPILVTLKVNEIDLEMKLDTGATLSVISEHACFLFCCGTLWQCVLSFCKSCIQHLGIYSLLVYVLLHIGSSRLTLADWAELD